jgi:hypothetical protein
MDKQQAKIEALTLIKNVGWHSQLSHGDYCYIVNWRENFDKPLHTKIFKFDKVPGEHNGDICIVENYKNFTHVKLRCNGFFVEYKEHIEKLDTSWYSDDDLVMDLQTNIFSKLEEIKRDQTVAPLKDDKK